MTFQSLFYLLIIIPPWGFCGLTGNAAGHRNDRTGIALAATEERTERGIRSEDRVRHFGYLLVS